MPQGKQEAPALEGLVNLADSSLGAVALQVSDEFFAPRERMLAPAEPISRPGVFDDHGQWMDGWETRRRRSPGHDTCTILLAYPGTIRYVDIDTRFFTGNFPPCAWIEATREDPRAPDPHWVEILPRADLGGDRHNWFAIDDSQVWRQLRLHIDPDGGIARLRVYGNVWRDWGAPDAAEPLDLAALANGGRALACSDQHYGHMSNLLRPGRGRNMGDGWETRRRRGPGFDWVILALGHPGRIGAIEADTAHFKGNYPDRVSMVAALVDDEAALELSHDGTGSWSVLLPAQRLAPDSEQRFESQVIDLGVISHVRVDIHPDGGLSRVRLWGRPAR